VRLLDIACGPLNRAVSFCLEFGLVLEPYLVVGHVFFNDHFEFRVRGCFEVLV
jgi:hypothetical protein